MRPIIALSIVGTIMFLLATSVQAAWTRGPLGGTFAGAGSVLITGFETTFPAGGPSEAWTITVTSSTNAGCVVYFMDVTRSAGGGPVAFDFSQWDAANPLTGITGAGTSTPFTYNTPAYNGTLQRFSMLILPFNSGGTYPNNITVTINNPSGNSSTPTGVTGVFSDNFAANIGASGTSEGYFTQLMNSYDCNLSSTLINAPADEIQYNFSVNYSGVATPRPFSLWANVYTPGGGNGNLNVELWDMTADGFGSTPTLQLSLNSTAGTGLSGGEQNAVSATAPAGRVGVHNFRLIVRPGPGFVAPCRVWWQVTFDRTETTSAVTGNPPVQATPRVAISPAGATLVTSPTTLTGSGGTGAPASYNWTIQGATPTGVSLSSPSGATTQLIFGASTPTSSTVTVRAANGATGEFSEETYTLNFGGTANTVSVTASDPSAGEPSDDGVWTITFSTATTANTDVVFAVSGAAVLSNDYSLSPNLGGIAGNTLTVPAGTTTVLVTVDVLDDGNPESTEDAIITLNSATQGYTVGSPSQATVNITDDDGGGGPALTIITTTLPNGQVGVAYASGNIVAQATGGASTSVTWSVSSGALPGGLSLGGSTNLTETISGTPTASGVFNFDLQVTNGAQSDTQSYSVTISPAGGVLTITTLTLGAGTSGTLYGGGAINSTGGTGNHTWSIIAGILPAGLSLGAGPGASTAIAGTPTQTGTFPITVQVTDSSGVPQTDTQAYTLVINASGGGGGGGGGGSGGGGGGGCAADSSASWILAIGLIALFGFALRMRSRRA
jgi:hypothetical protein